MSAYSEAERPSRKMTPWVAVLLVALVGLAVAHIAGLTKPLTSMAMQLAGYGRLPGSRLVGDWESSNDPMFQRLSYTCPKGDAHRTGFYMADGGRGMKEVLFKITSEDRSGSRVEMSEFLPGVNESYHARYSIADDGLSMTREYDRNGTHVTSQYRYVGPPTQSPPPVFSGDSMSR